MPIPPERAPSYTVMVDLVRHPDCAEMRIGMAHLDDDGHAYFEDRCGRRHTLVGGEPIVGQPFYGPNGQPIEATRVMTTHRLWVDDDMAPLVPQPDTPWPASDDPRRWGGEPTTC